MNSIKLIHLLNPKQQKIIEQRQKDYGSYAHFLALTTEYKRKNDICPYLPYDVDLNALLYTEFMLAMKLARLVLQKDVELKTDSFDDIVGYLVLTHNIFNDFEWVLEDKRFVVNKLTEQEDLKNFLRIFIEKEMKYTNLVFNLSHKKGLK